MRNWSGTARLNGQNFENSVLTPGDVLEIGTYRIRLLAEEDSRCVTPNRPSGSLPGDDGRLVGQASLPRSGRGAKVRTPQLAQERGRLRRLARGQGVLGQRVKSLRQRIAKGLRRERDLRHRIAGLETRYQSGISSRAAGQIEHLRLTNEHLRQRLSWMVAGLKKRTAEWNQQSQRYQAEILRQGQQLAAWTARLENQDAEENAELQQRKRTLEQHFQALAVQRDQFEAEKQAWQVHCQTESSTFQDERTQLERDLFALTERERGVQTRIATCDEREAGLMSTADELQAQEAAVRQARLATESVREGLEVERQQYQVRLAGLEQQLVEVTARSQAEIHQFHCQIDRQDRNLEEANRQICTLQLDLERLQGEVTGRDDSIAELQQSLHVAIQEHERQRAEAGPDATDPPIIDREAPAGTLLLAGPGQLPLPAYDPSLETEPLPHTWELSRIGDLELALADALAEVAQLSDHLAKLTLEPRDAVLASESFRKEYDEACMRERQALSDLTAAQEDLQQRTREWESAHADWEATRSHWNELQDAWQQEREDLRSQLQGLNHQREKLQEELHQRQAESEAWTAERDQGNITRQTLEVTVAHLEAEVAEALEERERQQAHLQDFEASLRVQKELETELRSARSDIQHLEGQLQASQTQRDEIQHTLDVEHAASTKACELEEELRAARSAVERLAGQLQASQTQRDELQHALETEHAASTKARELEEELRAARSAMERLEGQLQASQTQRDEQRLAFDSERTAWENERDKLADDFQSHLDQLREEMDQARRVTAPQDATSDDSMRDARELPRDIDERIETLIRLPEGATENDDLNMAELVARFGLSSARNDAAAGTPERSSEHDVADDRDGQGILGEVDSSDCESPAAGHATEEADLAVEQYMHRLLGRSPAIDPPEEGNTNRTGGVSKASESRDALNVVDSDVEGSTEDTERPTMPQRRGKPEPISNLAAMRELANESVRHALDEHHRRQKGSRALLTLLLIAIFLVGGGICVVLGIRIHAWLSYSGYGLMVIGVLLGLRLSYGRRRQQDDRAERDNVDRGPATVPPRRPNQTSFRQAMLGQEPSFSTQIEDGDD